MCGISGFNWPDNLLIQEMNQVNKYRGPDFQNYYCNDIVSLGHTRLSIVDLSNHGNQPLCNEDNSLFLIHNGEIYNFLDLRQELLKKGHRFSSQTDSEVIIHAYEEYGIDCLHRFNGMWAFCLFDSINQRLIIARDRFGIKPIYYYSDTERFIFSSMISALLVHDLDSIPNDKVIMNFLAFNLQSHTSETFFSSIFSLEPGHYLQYDLKSKTLTKYRWYFPKKVKTDKKQVKNTFVKAVADRTIADVDIGCCLSGGVDSSTIAVVLSEHLNRLKTFSLIAPGTPVDESFYIKEVGKSIQAIQYYTEVNPVQFLHDFEDFIRAQEEPVAGLSPYAQYVVMKLVHDSGIKVVLDGQGGDELFAGYIYYYGWYFYELLSNKKILTLITEIIFYLRVSTNILPIKMLLGLLIPEKLMITIWKKYEKPWLNHAYAATFPSFKDPRWDRLSLEKGLELTLFSTAIPHLLLWEDKNSMRWSVESRLPFLDYTLVEQALSIPSEQKLGHGRTKVIFKEAMDSLIPEIVRKRTDKIGFEVPGDDFFRDERVVRFAESVFYSEKFASRPYWDKKQVCRLFARHISGKKNAGNEIYKLLHVEMWLRLFFDPVNDNVSCREKQ